MRLTKSKYCEGLQCKKMLWLDEYKSDLKKEENSSVLDNGTDVGIVARDLFGSHIVVDYNSGVSVMARETDKLMAEDKIVIAEASFIYDDSFCSVDILVKRGNDISIYEVKSSTEIKDVYIDDISYQYYVLSNLGLNIRSANLVILNSNYERHGALDLHKLFIITDVTNDVILKQGSVEENIDEYKDVINENEEPDIDLGMHCVNPYECPFFDYCKRDLPEQNVFNIRRMRNSSKFKLYKNNKYRYEDLLSEDIDDMYKQQIEFELCDKDDYIDKESIKSFLNTLSYPLYFLDFETYQQAIPEYDYVRPYMQIPFQYSLHYIDNEDGELYHKEFLAESGVDPRRALAERLVEDIPMNVCTVAYNMMFERMVIKNLANLYPDLSEHLMNIHDNMKDLMIPFKDRQYYVKNMYGSYSIKYVLPALFPNEESLNYHNLELVHNGSEAMNTFANLKDMNPSEREYTRFRLLRYCELDTYAMVKIWQKLLEVTK